jgi:hypothetical protein
VKALTPRGIEPGIGQNARFRRPAVRTRSRRLSLLTIALCLTLLLMPRSVVTAAVSPIPPIAAVAPLPEPRMVVGGVSATSYPLVLSHVAVDVSVAGYLAQTTLTLTYRNDNDRPLEGELTFPLPEGVTISGYALDVDGRMVEGVPVEKTEARIAFDNEERWRVDPGLVEQAADAGNNYRTRIFPLPAHGQRSIRLRYAAPLDTDPATGLPVYRLPFRTGMPLLRDLQVHVSTNGAPGVPIAVMGQLGQQLLAGDAGRGFVRVAGDAISGIYSMDAAATNTRLTGDFAVVFPAGAGPVRAVAVETFTRESANAPEAYFAVTGIAPTPPFVQGAPAHPVRHVGVAWDASLSRLGSSLARERRLLGFMLDELLKRSPSGFVADLVVVRDSVDAVRPFAIRSAGDISALVGYLSSIPYDGGTDLGELRLGRVGSATTSGIEGAPYDLWLLFTDGLGNLGAESPHVAADAPPIFAVASDLRANHPLLRHLADETGGAYFDLQHWGDRDVLNRMDARQPLSLLSVTAVPAGSAGAFYPSGATAVEPGARVTVAGKLLGGMSTVTLAFGYGGAVASRQSFSVRRRAAPAVSSGLVGRFWAERKADALEELPATNRDALRTLGQQFDIVTPGTSLLVLENVDQYLRYGITPPRTLDVVYRQYQARRNVDMATGRQTARDHWAQLADDWEDWVRWWTSPDKREVEPQGADGGGFRGGAFGGGGGGVYAGAAEHAVAAHVVTAAAPVRLQANVAISTYEYASTGAAAGQFGSPGAAAVGATHTPGPQSVAATRMSANQPAFVQMAEARPVAANPGAYSLTGGAADAAAPPPAEDTITLQPWSPNTPYLRALRAAGPAGAYAAYLDVRPRFQRSPAFYLDCAEYLQQHGRLAEARHVLTSILDLAVEEPQLLRIVAHRLDQLGRRDLAIGIFEHVRAIRPDEPQSWRDLGLALIDRADAAARSGHAAENALADYNRGLSLLYAVVSRPWDRTPGIEVIALMEANRTLVHARAVLPLPQRDRLVDPLPARFEKSMPCELRVVMTWDTDQTDIDLWVTEPTAEKCYYAHNRTMLGGHLSHDIQDGYGPEEYFLRRAAPGVYLVQTNYFANHQVRLTGGTTIQATVITDWGRPTEKRQFLTVRLSHAQDTFTIGTIDRGKAGR